MRAPGLTIKSLAGTAVTLTLLTIPSLAMATSHREIGPTWKQIFGWGALGLVGVLAVYFLARWLYGVLLDAHWSVDFTLPLIVGGTLLTWAAIGTFIALYLYNWPQPWTQYTGFAFIGCYVLVFLIALFGRNR